ncbi:MAG: rod shape-determining protein MreD [Rhodospirillales bacterium]|nr:rod shape-determining protein MreD [Rhodospirillales bacterium]
MESADKPFFRPGVALRFVVPQLLLVSLALLNSLSFSVVFVGNLNPFFVVMAIYYWAIYRPTLVAPLWCMLLGLLMDIVAGGALGVNAVILVLVQFIVRTQRRFLMGQPFVVMWFIFGLMVETVALLQWGLQGIAVGMWGDIMPAIINGAVSFFLFPFISMLLVLTHRMLPAPKKTMGGV